MLVKDAPLRSDAVNVLVFVNILDFVNVFDFANEFDSAGIFDCANVFDSMNVSVGGRHSPIVVPLEIHSLYKMFRFNMLLIS